MGTNFRQLHVKFIDMLRRFETIQATYTHHMKFCPGSMEDHVENIEFFVQDMLDFAATLSEYLENLVKFLKHRAEVRVNG